MVIRMLTESGAVMVRRIVSGAAEPAWHGDPAAPARCW
jgi:hypothetical protein